MNREQFLYHSSEKLHISKDILANAMLVCLEDNRSLHIENYRSILNYSPEQLTLKGKNVKCIITGKNLEILEYVRDECYVLGECISIAYETEG